MAEEEGIDILVLDDEASIRWVIGQTLSGSGHRLHFAESAEQASELVEKDEMDFALVDINLPGDDGFAFLRQQRSVRPELLVAVITGQSSMDNAVTAMKLGAFDYLTKPFDIEEIESLVERAARAVGASRNQPGVPLPSMTEPPSSDILVGESRQMREIYKSIGRVAATDINVLIQGESGTGKELVASSIHHHSDRAQQPFLAINCAAIPRELLESDLFGYEKGAFTGATKLKVGRLEAAGGGTVLLDEIGEIPLDLQAKLLRVLQEREFQRVSGLETIPLKARIISATNQSLLEQVDAGAFRGDLYYRIGAFTIDVSPLRTRREDIPPLVSHFLRAGARSLDVAPKEFTSEALEALTAYDWPGNVRELENAVKSLMIMTATRLIGLGDLPRNIAGESTGSDGGRRFEQGVLQQWGGTVREACAAGETGLLARLTAHLERPLIRQVLSCTGWNQVKAAAVLGINRNTLRTKMRALNISKPGSASKEQ